MSDTTTEPPPAGAAEEPAPQPVPVNALFGMDFVTHLVVLFTTDDMAQVAEKIAHHTVGRRLPSREGAEMAVYYRGRRIPTEATVAEAGIGPLQFVFADYV